LTTFTRKGPLILMEPWDPGLAQALSYTRREMKGAYGYRPGRARPQPTYHRENLFSAEGGSALFPAGLLPRAQAWLDARHMPHTYAETRDMSKLMPPPDFAAVDLLREGQDEVLLKVASHDGGLLVGGTGIGKSFLIVQICKMYPSLKIVIVSPRISVVNTLHGRLLKELGSAQVAKVGAGGDSKSEKRVTIATARSILKAPIRDCDLLLFDEVHNVGYNQIADHLAYVEKGRKFGFTATPSGRCDGAELVMEALFGGRLIDIPYADAVDKGLVTPIEVLLYGGVEGPDVTGSQSVVQKRHAYWRNEKRNSRIAQVARSFPAEEQVLIMVETLEHAINLHKLLPEYTVVSYGTPGKDKLGGVDTKQYKTSQKELDSLREQFAAGTLKKVLATTVWREGVDFCGLSVLIRADGQSSQIASMQIPGRLSRLSEGKNVGVLVDFEDNFCTWAYNRSQARLAIYRRAHWKITRKN